MSKIYGDINDAIDHLRAEGAEKAHHNAPFTLTAYRFTGDGWEFSHILPAPGTHANSRPRYWTTTPWFETWSGPGCYAFCIGGL